MKIKHWVIILVLLSVTFLVFSIFTIKFTDSADGGANLTLTENETRTLPENKTVPENVTNVTLPPPRIDLTNVTLLSTNISITNVTNVTNNTDNGGSRRRSGGGGGGGSGGGNDDDDDDGGGNSPPPPSLSPPASDPVPDPSDPDPRRATFLTLIDGMKQNVLDLNRSMWGNYTLWKTVKQEYILTNETCHNATTNFNRHQSRYNANITKFNNLIRSANETLQERIPINASNSTYLRYVQRLFFDCNNDVITHFNQSYNEKVGCGKVRAYKHGSINRDGHYDDYTSNVINNYNALKAQNYKIINDSINNRIFLLGHNVTLARQNISNINISKNSYIASNSPNPHEETKRQYCNARDGYRTQRINLVKPAHREGIIPTLWESICIFTNHTYNNVTAYNNLPFDDNLPQPNETYDRIDANTTPIETINELGHDNDQSKWAIVPYNPINTPIFNCSSTGAYW